MRTVPKLALGLAGAAVASVLAAPPALGDVAAPIVSVVNTDEVVTEATQPTVPTSTDPDKAGQYRCNFSTSGYYTAQSTTGGSLDIYAGIECTDTMRFIDSYAWLIAESDDGTSWSYYAAPDRGRATCADCVTPSHPAHLQSNVNLGDKSGYYLMQGDFSVVFAPGKATRFSPLCSPPSGDTVTCRQFRKVFVPAASTGAGR